MRARQPWDPARPHLLSIIGAPPDVEGSVASIQRIKNIAASQKATVIIQHDARDVEKLPVFPAFAK